MLITGLVGDLVEWLLDLYDTLFIVVVWGVSGSPEIPLMKNFFFFFTLLVLKANINLINLIFKKYGLTIQLS